MRLDESGVNEEQTERIIRQAKKWIFCNLLMLFASLVKMALAVVASTFLLFLHAQKARKA